MVICEKSDDRIQIRLLPNRSATWQQTVKVLVGLSGFILSIAVVWAILGIWMILPFAGLEVALLSFLVFRVSARTYRQEVLSIGKHTVLIEGGISGPAWKRVFRRSDSEFVITKPAHSLSPAAIRIDSRQRSLRLGEFLNSEDVEALVEAIRASGVNYRVTGIIRIHALDAFESR